ncbi:MAG: glycosyltransferase family 2 protein [Candidatus Lokiarchaeota archaeon]|nr:glycosyltransferase family 2 protein [Candidatus Harpocratesius repetitus]
MISNTIVNTEIINNAIKNTSISTFKSSGLYPSTFISIIIPCYNESNTIIPIIEKIHSLKLANYEIIIVDDGSTDGTVEKLLERRDIRFIYHKNNQGYGRTILDGLKIARGDIFITIDGDGQHDPEDIPALCRSIIKNDADIIIGSRYKGEYYYPIPFLNRAGESFIQIFLKLFFHQSIKNNQGGFRAFHRKTKKIFEQIQFFDMAFTTELLMLGAIYNFKIEEVPIHLHGRCFGKSNVRKFLLFFDIIKGFFYYYLRKFNVI